MPCSVILTKDALDFAVYINYNVCTFYIRTDFRSMRNIIISLFLVFNLLLTACGTSPAQPSAAVEGDKAPVHSAVTESEFTEAISAAGYIDKLVFDRSFSDTEPEMPEKMEQQQIKGCCTESRPFYTTDLSGLEQYRLFRLSQPAQWQDDRYTWLTDDSITFFSFMNEAHAKDYVEQLKADIERFSLPATIELVSSGTNFENYVFQYTSPSGAVQMTHYVNQVENVVIHLECLPDSHALSILELLEQ